MLLNVASFNVFKPNVIIAIFKTFVKTFFFRLHTKKKIRNPIFITAKRKKKFKAQILNF